MTCPLPDAHPCRDEASFQAFHRSTSRGLWSYLFYLCQDRAWTDDLVQETYLRFLQAGKRIVPGANLAGYLYRIGYNLFIDQRQRRARETAWAPTSHSDSDFREPGGRAQQAVADGVEARAEAALIFEKVGGQDQLLLWLAYGEQLEHREIARRLRLREKSVKVLLFRARRRLAELLNRGKAK
jgi:RNA polymerase sigma-70 factor (ECF subfamily)